MCYAPLTQPGSTVTTTPMTPMVTSDSHPTRPLGIVIGLLIGSLCIGIVAGCALFTRTTLVHTSERGSVSLEQFPDRGATARFSMATQWFQATHPLFLDQHTVTKLLSGTHIHTEKPAVQGLLSLNPSVTPAFTQEEIPFLAPLLTAALARAEANQYVRFVSRAPSATGFEKTTGFLFAHGRSLHLTLTEFHHQPERADMVSMPNRQLPDPTGLRNTDLLFLPKDAQRPDAFKIPGVVDEGDVQATLVIDIELLVKLQAVPAAPANAGTTPSPVAPAAAMPAPQNNSPVMSKEPSQPMQPAAKTPAMAPSTLASAAEVQLLKDLVIKKDTELEAMKEELQHIKKQLAEREPSQPKSKKKTATRPSNPLQNR